MEHPYTSLSSCETERLEWIMFLFSCGFLILLPCCCVCFYVYFRFPPAAFFYRRQGHHAATATLHAHYAHPGAYSYSSIFVFQPLRTEHIGQDQTRPQGDRRHRRRHCPRHRYHQSPRVSCRSFHGWRPRHCPYPRCQPFVFFRSASCRFYRRFHQSWLL